MKRAAWDVDSAGSCGRLSFPWGLSEEPDEDVLADLLTACILVLLHETPASAAQLHGALVALRLHEDPAVVRRILSALEDLEFVVSNRAATGAPVSAGAQDRRILHIAPAGIDWLGRTTTALQDSEGFLGAFVARCAEHFL